MHIFSGLFFLKWHNYNNFSYGWYFIRQPSVVLHGKYCKNPRVTLKQILNFLNIKGVHPHSYKAVCLMVKLSSLFVIIQLT